jgi:polyferredoxin
LENLRIPLKIEDVPFRRQDRRILNSRKKRKMDRKLIRCILVMALLLLLMGGALIALWWKFETGE